MAGKVKYTNVTHYNVLFLNHSIVFHINGTSLFWHLYSYHVNDDGVDALINTVCSDQTWNPH